MNAGYQQILTNQLTRTQAEILNLKKTLQFAPLMRAAQLQGPHPDVLYSFKRLAQQARNGSYAMWLICIVLGGAFTVISYQVPDVADWVSAVIVFALWCLTAVLIGIGAEKFVQFGFGIQAADPDSLKRGRRGVKLTGLVVIGSFVALLILRTYISLAALIAVQAIFEIASLLAGSFFHALYEYYDELPRLHERIQQLEDQADRLKGELALLDAEAEPTARVHTEPASAANPCRARNLPRRVMARAMAITI